ncbi:MAG: sugar isomerase [Planctomycetota bacterium]|nr:sugar isomerase [Planctomycetota bacterium]
MTTAALAGGMLGLSSALAAEGPVVDAWDPDKPPVVTGRPLRVQPILAHNVMRPLEKTSWRSWSDIINEPAAAEEMQRIAGELRGLQAKAGFPLEILATAKVTTAEQAANVQKGDFDAVLLYAASNAGLFRPCCAAHPKRDTVVFVRHRSGPTYYGYECLGTRYFQRPSPELWQRNSADNHGGVTLDDVVVDDYEEVVWRLRALYGLKNFVGQRMLALGGALGKWDSSAPDVARKRYKLDIVPIDYKDLATRLEAIQSDAKLQQQFGTWTDRCLALPNTKLETKREFVHRAFGVYTVFRRWLQEHNAPAITVASCMGTIFGVSNTAACMPLSWLNDAGYIAFCESDFVVMPPGILLHYIAGKPVFMHNSTFPHKAIVTCAHCTAPRRMDGKRYEPVRIMTHFESDFGAAPKVEMPIGQQVCAISPEYTKPRWVGIKGIVRDNPSFAICRSQQDVEILGHWKRLIPEARDSHWMMVYGDYLREVGYAVRKIGLTWDNVSDTDA